MENRYRAERIGNKINFVNEAKEFHFSVEVENEKVKNIGDMHFYIPTERGKELSLSEQEELFKKVKKFILAETANYDIDGYHVSVYRSAAGYYVGCFCEDGPYCRLSGYSDYAEEAWIWLYEQREEE